MGCENSWKRGRGISLSATAGEIRYLTKCALERVIQLGPDGLHLAKIWGQAAHGDDGRRYVGPANHRPAGRCQLCQPHGEEGAVKHGHQDVLRDAGEAVAELRHIIAENLFGALRVVGWWYVREGEHADGCSDGGEVLYAIFVSMWKTQ